MMDATADTQASYFGKDAVGRIIGKIHLIPNPGLVETINYAMNAYSFLISRNETLSAAQFASRIRDTYDCETCPQNKAVVDALSQLH